MKRFGLVLLFAGLATIPGTVAVAQRPGGDAATPNSTYTTAGGVELKLDFYMPAQAAGPLPTER